MNEQQTNIDYSEVTTIKSFCDWAKDNINLSSSYNGGSIFPVYQSFRLSDIQKKYKVIELNKKIMSSEIKELLEGSDGLKQALGFHAFRDSGGSCYVKFE